ncbi:MULTISPECIES: OmpA family protein [Halocynthiibacter]|uniref:OmpA family protein n=1 Tax=Halocynthiibacter halioticoli TaxID=2986804 RepID=A0AAE3IZW9_9RHOB|nr:MULTISPECIES: OmpA family protein [Halocynthiibacter]MCV6825175.1 OmpA family protein [Halocynthiibacter halioticoli]MCW4058176.1 OmpA family protein [Halocynthiibacter sp. SDUM655004]
MVTRFRFLIFLLCAIFPLAVKAQDIGTVNFEFDSFALDANSQAQIAEIAEKLKAQQSYKQTVVVGYTDAVGSNSYNQSLGQKRATAVAQALVALGVPVARIGSVKSRGENDLVVKVATAERANRRVTVTLDDILAACRSYRSINISQSSVGDELQADLTARLQKAAGYLKSLEKSGRNGSAYQMAGAAGEDCNVAVGLKADSERKVEYAKRCFCSSARMEVALGLISN